MKYLKRSLGQHFLVDKNIIKKILSLTNLKNRNIIEIGPGKGALTHEILKRKPKNLILIEKDFSLFRELEIKFKKLKFVKVYNKDILKLDIEGMVKKNSLIIGNLPYNISSQILVKFLKFETWPPCFNDLIFMFQKELGEKIIGKYLSSNYGRLSIISNYRLNILKKFIVSSQCFFPRPKVTSMVINFQPKTSQFKIKNINNLEKVTNILFSNKRKMINKNIKKLLNSNQVQKILDLDVLKRPSEIKPEKYYKITELYEMK